MTDTTDEGGPRSGAAGPVLVLGATGFLGPHLVAAAARRGRAAFAASRDPRAAPWRPGAAPAGFHACDLAREGVLGPLLDTLRPATVVLASAASRVGACERDPDAARELNARAPERVARECAARGLRLVHLSTDLVFGGRPPAGERYAEDDAPSPVHVYGRTKAEGEQRVLGACPSALVVRLPLLYGDSGGRGLGATDQVVAALERGERPALFTDEWRTPLDAANAADAVLELAGGDARGLLHVAGPERLSRLELGLALLAARGIAPDAARARIRATTREELGLGARPSDVSLDARRARALLATPLLAPREALGAA